MNIKRSIAGLMFLGIMLTACNASTEKTIPIKHVVEIKQMLFQPAELQVHTGDTIEWINHDFVDHDITEEKNHEWSSGRLTNGQSWKYVIKKTTSYFCSIHVVMKGKIIITGE
ncbi:MAG: hypothetical protein JST09_20370 [Bacteroidetes bacterium]|nr:hypothetical protein [Bacteroidota bacterium]MBS1609734.1 hypothetical protein [Bacteroidota bacterium]